MQEVTFSKNFSNREVMFLNEQQFVNPYGACCVKGGAQVLAKKLLQALRLHFAQSNSLLSETFDHQQLRCSQNHIGYKMYHARHLVFCEGWRAASNPFFPEIKFQPAKGELLRIRCSALPPDQIVMGAAVLTPADAESEFDVGAVYEWQAATQEPSPKNHELLLQLLAKTIRVPFEVVAHTAATRPTVYDRQPLAMFHHQYSTLSVINGLGTKGFMWAPFFAEWMSTEILMRLGNSFDN